MSLMLRTSTRLVVRVHANRINTYISVYALQTKTAKLMVGLSISVDTAQSLSVSEYIKQRGSSFVPLMRSTLQISWYSSFCCCFIFWASLNLSVKYSKRGSWRERNSLRAMVSNKVEVCSSWDFKCPWIEFGSWPKRWTWGTWWCCISSTCFDKGFTWRKASRELWSKLMNIFKLVLMVFGWFLNCMHRLFQLCFMSKIST